VKPHSTVYAQNMVPIFTGESYDFLRTYEACFTSCFWHYDRT